MAPSSSGGSTVGEALNILETEDIAAHERRARRCTTTSRPARWRSRTAAPTSGTRRSSTCRSTTCSRDTFAKERACEIEPTTRDDEARPRPATSSDYDGVLRRRRAAPPTEAEDTENVSTTNLTVTDKWGNVVEYTLTIEQTGGSGIVVPGRGFLLNNELTDFSDRLRRRPTRTGSSRASGRAPRCRRRSCCRTASRSSRSARPAARRSSPPCCRCCSTGSTAA